MEILCVLGVLCGYAYQEIATAEDAEDAEE